MPTSRATRDQVAAVGGVSKLPSTIAMRGSGCAARVRHHSSAASLSRWPAVTRHRMLGMSDRYRYPHIIARCRRSKLDGIADVADGQAKPSSRSIDVPSHRTVNASMDGRPVASINTVTSVKGAASRRTRRSVVLGTTGRRLVRFSRGLDRGRSRRRARSRTRRPHSSSRRVREGEHRVDVAAERVNRVGPNAARLTPRPQQAAHVRQRAGRIGEVLERVERYDQIDGSAPLARERAAIGDAARGGVRGKSSHRWRKSMPMTWEAPGSAISTASLPGPQPKSSMSLSRV